MTKETDFISALSRLADHPAARGLLDDAAVLALGEADIVLTQDMLVEGVHYLPADPPGDVAWKLLAVNLSDLAAKGAEPVGVLVGYSLAADEGWNADFVDGLGKALAHFNIALLGGDTVAAPAGTPRTLALTAIGKVPPGGAPSRAGAGDGDILWVSGTIGDAGAGLRILKGEIAGHPELIDRYRRPEPRLEAGRLLAPLASAMMDVSDGLLIDARRLTSASEVAIAIDIDCVPISRDYLALSGDEKTARLSAATSGDDYELLFTAPPKQSDRIFGIGRSLGLAITPIGRVASGAGLTLIDRSGPLPLPERLGYEHGGEQG